jgi:hypothetical protein
LKYTLLIPGLIVIASVAAAKQTSYFCSKTNSLIKLGDRFEHVIDQCGPPTRLSQSNDLSHDETKGAQWVYNFQNTPKGKAAYKKVKRGLVANIVKLKIVGLFENGHEVNSTHFCDSVNAIKVGDYQASLWRYCGKPSVVKPVTIIGQSSLGYQTVATYQDGSGGTQVTFVFSGGALESIDS